MTSLPKGASQRAHDFAKVVQSGLGCASPTVVRLEGTMPCWINSFWTATQRQGHALHEVPYRACFKPELPAFLIKHLTKPGEVVFDPFMGRGTVPLEALLQKRQAAGNDINPLSIALLQPRLAPPALGQIQEALTSIPWEGPLGRGRLQGHVAEKDLLAFYHPGTLRQLKILRRWLNDPVEGQPRHGVDNTARWIRMVALARLSGHSSGYFSAPSMPPNQAVSAARQRALNERRGAGPPERPVAAIITKKSRSLLRDGPPPLVGDGVVPLFTRPAWSVPAMATGSVDLVVTSPPFLDVVHYGQANWLRCWFAGFNSKAVQVSVWPNPMKWQAMAHDVLVEMARLLRPGGFLAFEVGKVRKGTVDLAQLVWETAQNLPYRRLGCLVHEQGFTKTAHCWGVDNNQGGTNGNRIVLFERL
ncbi:site-specific DNA-methyltransferase [Formicincola oecophyllae]|uniref:Site-specific DNA-methyltransferase n=1 Tax=Formicincola oecophyllae TaxID=2558361 RepID=A0A4Y6U7P4_9PROT|nr:DNA methyltransferase [Formicincola oecophyllae]QDH13352.1 site-specific DNA-methyltransferase [Formicincola oecophyllae]